MQDKPKVKIFPIRLIGYRDVTNNSCKPQLCQYASQVLKKALYKQTWVLLRVDS